MVLDVVRIPRPPRPPIPHPGPKPAVKVDARSERWKGHRKKVRAEIVDAAFRAIDRLGPDLSVREVAEEAGTAKPKIYRHFTDKSDLFQAIGERLRDMLWAAIFPSIDLATDSAREVIRRSVDEYVSLIDKHPNVVRVFIQDRSAATSQSTVRTLNEGREITLAMADMFDNELRDMELDHAAMELAAHAAFGSAASATGWWLGSDIDSPRRMPRDKFVEHLSTIMLGVVSGTAELLGIKLDPDQPIHNAVPHDSAVS
jgi:AcrR family transcriptional regulator